MNYMNCSCQQLYCFPWIILKTSQSSQTFNVVQLFILQMFFMSIDFIMILFSSYISALSAYQKFYITEKNHWKVSTTTIKHCTSCDTIVYVLLQSVKRVTWCIVGKLRIKALLNLAYSLIQYHFWLWESWHV